MAHVQLVWLVHDGFLQAPSTQDNPDWHVSLVVHELLQLKTGVDVAVGLGVLLGAGVLLGDPVLVGVGVLLGAPVLVGVGVLLGPPVLVGVGELVVFIVNVTVHA